MIRRERTDARQVAIRAVSLPFLLEGWVDAVPPLAVSSLCIDVRHLQRDCAFVARSATDARRAQDCGARVVLHDECVQPVNISIPTVIVPSLGKLLPKLAARFHHHPADQMDLAAVAGGQGRTAAAWYIAQSWQRSQGNAGLIGRLGQGVFSSLDAATRSFDAVSLQRCLAECVAAGAETAALEAGPGLLERGCLDEVALKVAVYTGNAHSPQSDDTDRLQPLFDRHAPRFAVINHDSAEGKRLASRAGTGIEVLTFGRNGATELRGSILSQDSGGMSIRIASPGGGGELRTALLGAHSLDGLLAAAGALVLMGMPWNRVMHQLEIMSPVPGRLACIAGEGNRPAAVIDHASTPQALEHALLALRAHLHGRLYCILNTGGVRRRALAEVASSLSDQVVSVTRSSRSMVLSRVLREARGHDIVLIAGGGRGEWSQRGEAEVRHLLEEAA